MVTFEARIERYDSQGEKTGWTYITIPAAMAGNIKPGTRKTYRVRGRLDDVPVRQLALVPVGGGDYILPLRSDLRRKLRKDKGASLQVQLEADPEAPALDPDLLECLSDEPAALARFNSLPPSHRQYFARWVGEARTLPTKSARITRTVAALVEGLDFGAMLRKGK